VIDTTISYRKIGFKAAILFVTLLIMWWRPVGVFAEDLVATKALMCLDVKARVPVGEAQEFPATVKEVYCFTVVEGAREPAQITHVWSYKGEKLREIPLPVKSIRWRTWSYKNISPSQVGPWTVDVIDDTSQKVIGTIQFRIY
jgi:hypothetical protein